YLTARGTYNINPLETVPWADRFQVRAMGLSSGVSLSQAKAAVDRAIAASARLHIYIHRLGAVADGTTWVTSDYLALLEYIYEKTQTTKLRVETPDQQYAQDTALAARPD